MKRAAVYQLKDRILLHPWQRTDMGLGIGTEPYVPLPLEVAAANLGTSVLEVLGQSGRTIPHPKVWKGQGAERLKAAGVRSERAFQAGSRYVGVERKDAGFVIEPSRNGGTKGDAKGFEPLPSRAIALGSDASAEDLGNAIRQGLEISQEQSE
jgi:hypothetical protein